jgi:hypothetical protein
MSRFFSLILLFACLVLQAHSQVTKKPVNKTPVKDNKSIYHSLKFKKDYITTYYEEPLDSSHQVWYKTFKEEKFLEKMKGVLNDVFKINKPLKLSMRECGQINAFYNPDDKELILCYEILEFLKKQYEDRYPDPDSLGTKIGQALTFIYFHEVGHALIDLLDIPLTGKEEDAADYFAFYFLASNEVPEGVEATSEGANFFKDLSKARDSMNMEKIKKGETVDLPFWDEHSFEMQRFYTIFSLIYGSNPDKNEYLAENGFLGKRRRAIAISEYKKIKKGWDRVLKDFIKWKN